MKKGFTVKVLLALLVSAALLLSGCALLNGLTALESNENQAGSEQAELPALKTAPIRTQNPTEGLYTENQEPQTGTATAEADSETLPEDGVYTSMGDVALYLDTYGHLPDNFMTKKEAKDLGWPGGSLEPYAPNMCIGGDRFGNFEGLLPEEKGRTYTECDIDTLGKNSRGAKRIVFSNDGLIYYTDDHYASFRLLYGEE